jgi:putative sigma-54 modulation protein
MKVNIQSLHFDADKKLLDFVNDRVGKLSHFGETILSSDVTLRLDKADNSENKIAEIKIHLKGSELFAKKQCKSFEEAIDSSVDALTSQIKKHKDKVKGL